MLFKQGLVLLGGMQFHGSSLSWEVGSAGLQRAKFKWEPFVSRLHCSGSWRGFCGASPAASDCCFSKLAPCLRSYRELRQRGASPQPRPRAQDPLQEQRIKSGTAFCSRCSASQGVTTPPCRCCPRTEGHREGWGGTGKAKRFYVCEGVKNQPLPFQGGPQVLDPTSAGFWRGLCRVLPGDSREGNSCS